MGEVISFQTGEKMETAADIAAAEAAAAADYYETFIGEAVAADIDAGSAVVADQQTALTLARLISSHLDSK